LTDEPSAGAAINVTNPLSAQHTVLRRHLIASLLNVLTLNERHGRESVAVFEIGKGYGRTDGKPREWDRLAFVLAGSATPPGWSQAARAYDLDDAKGLVELLCLRLRLPMPTYTSDEAGLPLHPGRALTVVARTDREALSGRVAELHPDVIAKWDLRAARVVVAELAIKGLSSGELPNLRVQPMPRFPEVDRDLAVIVDVSRPAAEVEACVRSHAGELVRRVALFDVYRGAPLAATEKSLAYRLVFGASDRTLTEAELDGAMADVRAGLEADLGARIRT
jgi:phenylalanyl-tRNA synthetase beta chain